MSYLCQFVHIEMLDTISEGFKYLRLTLQEVGPVRFIDEV